MAITPWPWRRKQQRDRGYLGEPPLRPTLIDLTISGFPFRRLACLPLPANQCSRLAHGMRHDRAVCSPLLLGGAGRAAVAPSASFVHACCLMRHGRRRRRRFPSPPTAETLHEFHTVHFRAMHLGAGCSEGPLKTTHGHRRHANGTASAGTTAGSRLGAQGKQ